MFGKRPLEAGPPWPQRAGRPLRTTPRTAKAAPSLLEPAMTAILMILAFIVVIGALNYFEFGRLD